MFLLFCIRFCHFVSIFSSSTEESKLCELHEKIVLHDYTTAIFYNTFSLNMFTLKINWKIFNNINTQHPIKCFCATMQTSYMSASWLLVPVYNGKFNLLSTLYVNSTAFALVTMPHKKNKKIFTVTNDYKCCTAWPHTHLLRFGKYTEEKEEKQYCEFKKTQRPTWNKEGTNLS